MATEQEPECDGRCLRGTDVGLPYNEVAIPDPLCSAHGPLTERETKLVRLTTYTAVMYGLHVGACRLPRCTHPSHGEGGTIGGLCLRAHEEVVTRVARDELDQAIDEWERDPDVNER